MSHSRSPYSQCLFFSSNAIARALTKMADEEFAVSGLSPSHGFILMTVNNRPGISAGDVANAMKLSPSTVTRLIEKLERMGFLERRSEGKFTRIYSTEKGLAHQSKLQSSWARLSNRYGQIIGKEKGQHLSAYLTEALESIQES